MKNIILTTVAIALSFSVFGWGQIGHRAIGKIAENHLTESAKKNIKAIMGHESLAESSTWMDEVRSDSKYDFAKTWHYVTIPDGSDYESAEHKETGDVFEAIGRMKDILKNANSSKEQQLEAIRMLTHLVGDMHQPLHVGNGEDRGGNNVKVKWFYDDSNLHRIWDSGMIDQKQYSYTELAQIVDGRISADNDDLYSTDLNVWVAEAMELRPQVYDFGTKDYFDYEYMHKNWDTVKIQIHKAGVRLAQILNEIYG